MDFISRRLALVAVLALALATDAHAQSASRAPDRAVMPVWNQASGRLEAVLLLEPAATRRGGPTWTFGAGSPGSGSVLDRSSGLGLVCDRKTGSIRGIGNLVDNCMVAALDGADSRRLGASTSVGGADGRLGVSIGAERDQLPGWLTPNSRPTRFDQNSLTVYGQRNVGREATVSIGGTWARARLVPVSDVPASVTDRWTSKSFAVGAGLGAFGANIVGRVVDTPSQPGGFKGLDLGFTWRTPWRGQLSVGAENVVTRGRNPFSPRQAAQDDDGTVPYVRYEQDL